jgi:hypothetical protein
LPKRDERTPAGQGVTCTANGASWS